MINIISNHSTSMDDKRSCNKTSTNLAGAVLPQVRGALCVYMPNVPSCCLPKVSNTNTDKFGQFLKL